MDILRSKPFRNRKEDTSVSTSKVWLLITGLIFVTSLVVVLVLMATKTDILDTAVYVTIITVTGGIFGSNLCWYSKKASSENHYKLRAIMYDSIIDKQLYYNEKMIKMRKKYNISAEDMQEIMDSGSIDEMVDNEISSMENKLDQDRDETESPDELRTFDNF